MSPGIADLYGSQDLILKHMMKLINFAKSTLSKESSHFRYYPIFFKATGGMRQIPLQPREEIMSYVRSILSNKTLCPFYFHHDMARVISGEEEAIYSWTAVNFLMGTLLPASEGQGTASPRDQTYGTLDLGGSSSQIAFFVPSQVDLFIPSYIHTNLTCSFYYYMKDVSEGLFKLQIGCHKHWNVYTKSFLQFGHVSARIRHVNGLADDAVRNMNLNIPVVPNVLNYCFFSGYSENVYVPATEDIKSNIQVLITGPPVPAQDQLYRCLDAVRPLLVKYNNDYCNVVYDGQCSINGAYQPSVSESNQRQFIGTSSYRYSWKILLLPDTSSLEDYKRRAEFLCSLSFRDVIHYYEVNNLNTVDDKLGEMIPNYCFLVSYTYALLTEGYGFHYNQSITVLDQVRGNKVGWALGAIFYEINTMPWELDISDFKRSGIISTIVWFTIGKYFMH
jgi:Golgi nucleoside diphosphatase